MEIKTFKVKEGNREQTVIIPKTGDKSYDDYLEEAEREKTSEQLKKNQRPQSTVPREQVVGALREFHNFIQRKKEGGKKYY